MKFTLTLLVSLLSVLFSSCSGQPEPKLTGFKADLWVERVPIQFGYPHSCSRQQVVLLVGDGRVGIITPTDTLALERKRFDAFFTDRFTDVLYTVSSAQSQEGFLLFITPYPHQEKAIYCLVLSTKNLCEK
jgi:hypothetical protein